MSDILERQCEQAVKSVVTTATSAGVDGVALHLHTFLPAVDTTDTADSLTLPLCNVKSAPAMQPGYRSVIYEVPITVTIVTHRNHDRIRSQLIGFYAMIRPALEDSDFTGLLDGYRFIGFTFGDSSSDIIDDLQLYEFAATMRIQETTTTTTTTTTP